MILAAIREVVRVRFIARKGGQCPDKVGTGPLEDLESRGDAFPVSSRVGV
jgi:hypothetical protein